MSMENSIGDLESEKKKKKSMEKSNGEDGFPCNLEPDKKKMKMSWEKNSGDGDLVVEDENRKMSSGSSREDCDVEVKDEKMSLEQQLIPPCDGDGDGDVEVEDEKKTKMSLESETWSSDDELKEEDMEAYIRYRKEVIDSGGFDISYRPQLFQCVLIPMENSNLKEEVYNNLCNYSQLAINKFNEDNNTSYKYHHYVKAVEEFCSGSKYYITFEAKRDSEEATTTFQALVYQGMRTYRNRPYNPEVVLVRKKSHATPEDNKILLC